jgi:hypothetical protein
MKQRIAQIVLWVDPNDCIAPHSLDMNSARDANKVENLRQQFEKNGFDINHSALVGYPLDGKIQLLSGTHRHLAAKQANVALPVTLWLRSDIERMWGTDLWDKAIQDIPVKDLLQFTVKEGFRMAPYDQVDAKLF